MNFKCKKFSLHEFLNGSIVFLLKHRFAKNNTPIFHMETMFLFLLHLLSVIVTGRAAGVALKRFSLKSHIAALYNSSQQPLKVICESGDKRNSITVE